MRTYKIFVDGMYVGTEEFSAEEVKTLNNAEDIVLALAQEDYAQATHQLVASAKQGAIFFVAAKCFAG